MSPTVKVVKKNIRGWLSPNLDEEIIAMEIQEQENQGWLRAPSFGGSSFRSGIYRHGHFHLSEEVSSQI